MKKIGLDLRLLGTQNGGIGRYCKELFPRLLEMDHENQYFLFFNQKNLRRQDFEIFEKFSNAQLIKTNFRHYSFGEQLGFLRSLNKHNLDLVHFPNFNFPVFYKKPFVVTIHDMVHHKISGAKKSHLLHFLAYKKVIAKAAQNAREIITVSNASKKDISQLLNVPIEKVSVTYEGASLNTVVSDDAVAKVKQSFLLTRPYFLFVGVLERKKNLVNLSRGFDYFLKNSKVNMDLVIVGKADRHYPEIRHEAMDIKHPQHLVFTGQVDENELAALYKEAFAYVSPSLHEGFGLPGVEALSFGLPLLVSNIAVYNEIYDDAAIYFNPLDPSDIGDKMNLLVRDAQFYEQIQKKSFDRSLLFNWENTARETLGIYQKLL